MIIYKKYTGWRQNDFNIHAYLVEGVEVQPAPRVPTGCAIEVRRPVELCNLLRLRTVEDADQRPRDPQVQTLRARKLLALPRRCKLARASLVWKYRYTKG